jgi:hypothetical protein
LKTLATCKFILKRFKTLLLLSLPFNSYLRFNTLNYFPSNFETYVADGKASLQLNLLRGQRKNLQAPLVAVLGVEVDLFNDSNEHIGAFGKT